MTRVALTVIAFDAGTQIRAAIDPAVVAEYAEAMTGGAQFPPIVLFHDGSQHYLADGFHRFLAAQRNTYIDIAADVRPGTKEDALWFALGANKSNGQRLTDGDKRHAITLAFHAWPDRSSARIAEQVGCSPMYVSTIKSGLSTTLDLPSRVTGRDGHSYPASPAARLTARESATALLQQGRSSQDVQKATGIGRDTLNEVRRSLGMVVDKSKSGVKHRRDQMRTMAAEGHTSRQIAAAIGLSESGCRTTLRKAGIAVPADHATRGTHRHDPNRIVDGIVMDAENLTEGVRLIDFEGLDRSRLADWLRSLTTARDHLGLFIRRLMKEQQQYGEVSDPQAVQDSPRSHRADAHPARARHAARVSESAR